MKIKRWKRLAFASLLAVFMAFAYHARAAARACPRAACAQKSHAKKTVLRGIGFVRFAGYDLNLSFTPEGRFVGLDISAAPSKKSNAG